MYNIFPTRLYSNNNVICVCVCLYIYILHFRRGIPKNEKKWQFEGNDNGLLSTRLGI